MPIADTVFRLRHCIARWGIAGTVEIKFVIVVFLSFGLEKIRAARLRNQVVILIYMNVAKLKF